MSSGQRSLAGRTALVTGSGRNIGRAVAVSLAADGADLVSNGHRDRAAVDSVVAEVQALGSRAVGVMADVAEPGEVAAMVAAAVDAFGGLDIAVSNVGVRRRQPFEEITIADWHATLAANLHAAFYLAHHCLPAMRQAGWGRIVHISGYDGWTGHLEHRAHNVTAKAALHGLTKALAREYGVHGITANTVAPGAIATQRDWSQYAHINLDAITDRLAIKHFGEATDIAAACGYLAGEGGRFVTGQVIHVNGGSSCSDPPRRRDDPQGQADQRPLGQARRARRKHP